MGLPGNRSLRSILRNVVPYFLCLSVLVLLTWRIVFLGDQPMFGDIPYQFLPWKSYARENLLSGQVPLWNPHTYGGAPFLANLQSAVFYPLDLILFAFPMEFFFGLSLLLHLLLGLWLTMRLGLACGLSRWASSLAALVYALNGFVMIHIMAGNHLTYIAIAWAPALFLTALQALRAPALRWRDCACFALLMSMQILCGHPQMAFYAFFFTAIFLTAYGGSAGRDRLIRGLTAFCIGGAIAGILCAFQIVPTFEYIPLSGRRSALSFEQATEFSFSWHRLIGLFAGEFFGSHAWGNHWDRFYYWSSAYGGAVTPFLAILGAWSWRSKRSLWLGLLLTAVLALFLACGRDNPLYRVVLTLPGFKYFRAPAKFLPWMILPMALFAGRGLDWLVCHLRSRKTAGKGLRSLALPALTVFVGLFGLSLVVKFHEFQSAQNLSVVRIAAVFVAVGFLLVALSWYGVGRQFRICRGSVFAIGMVILIGADLWLYGYKYVDGCLAPAYRARVWLTPPPEAQLLQSIERQSGPFRVAMVGNVPFPNMTIPWNLMGVSGYDPMSLRFTMDLLAASEGWEPDRFVDSVELKKADSPIYDLFDVRFLLGSIDSDALSFKMLFNGPYFRVYERTASPRAVRWVALEQADYRPESDIPRSPEDLLQLSWDRPEINCNSLEMNNLDAGDAEGSAEILSWKAQEIRLRYKSTREGWLVLSLPWYPGWTSYVDGERGESSVRAMHAFTAFRVPAGEQVVSVRFLSRSWKIGCFISSLGLIGVIAWFVWTMKLAPEKTRSQPSFRAQLRRSR
ncbi:MAG TPA: YfhO family protein [bacterium]|nr:YfhO family protein [bacterium]